MEKGEMQVRITEEAEKRPKIKLHKKSLLALHGVWCRVETMEKRGDIRPQALAWLTPPFRWKPVRCPITNQRPFVLCCNRFSLRTKPTHSQVQVSKRSRCLICKMYQRVYWSRRRRRRSWVSHSVGSGRVESGTIQADTQSPQAHRQGSTFDQSDHWSLYYIYAGTFKRM